MRTRQLFLLILLFVSAGVPRGLAQTSGQVFFNGSYDDFLREAKKQNKVALLDFRVERCSSCQKLEKETFQDPELQKFLDRNYLIRKIELNSSEGKLLADKYRVDEFPALVLLDFPSRSVRKLNGFYQPDYLKKELEKFRWQPMSR